MIRFKDKPKDKPKNKPESATSSAKDDAAPKSEDGKEAARTLPDADPAKSDGAKS